MSWRREELEWFKFPLPQFCFTVGRGCFCLMHQIGIINEAESMRKASAVLQVTGYLRNPTLVKFCCIIE